MEINKNSSLIFLCFLTDYYTIALHAGLSFGMNVLCFLIFLAALKETALH